MAPVFVMKNGKPVLIYNGTSYLDTLQEKTERAQLQSEDQNEIQLKPNQRQKQKQIQDYKQKQQK